MPSSRPITNSGCGVGPLYSSTRAIGSSPSQAIPQRVRANSRSSRSQIAYAAYSRSRSRKARSRRLVGRRPGDDRAAPADRDGGHQSATAAGWAWRRRRSVGPGVGCRGRRRLVGRAAGRIARKPGIDAQRSRARSVASRRPASNGPRRTPSSVTMPVISSAGVTSNAGLRTSVPGGAMRTPRNSRTSSAAALLDHDRRAVRRREVDRARRGADVERDPVPGGEHGQRVRADLVGGVAVGRDPVGTDEDDVDLAARHQVPGGHIGEQRVRDAGLGQLPGRQPGALEVGPRLVDPDVDRATGMVRRLDDAERGPVLAAGQRPGVAVGQDADRAVVARRQDLQPELGQPAVVGGRLEDDRVGLGAHRSRDRVAVLGQLPDLGVAGQDALDRPAQVDRRRTRVDERVRRRRGSSPCARTGRPSALGLGAHRQPDGRDLADRRGAANDHLADRVGDLAGRAARVLDERVGEAALVDQVEDAAVLAERRPEAARAGRATGAGDPAQVVVRRSEPLRRSLGVQDDAGRLGRGLLERLGGPGHRRRGAGSAHRRTRGRTCAGRGRLGVGAGGPGSARTRSGRRGRARPRRVGRLARPGIAGGVGQSADLDAGRSVST